MEYVSDEVMNAISGEELRLLIEENGPHITPLYLRGKRPADDDGRARENTAISYGLRRLESQGGLTIGDGLNHGSPILLREFVTNELDRNRHQLEQAENYRAAEAAKVAAVLRYGALHMLEPLQGPEIPPQPPVLPETEV